MTLSEFEAKYDCQRIPDCRDGRGNYLADVIYIRNSFAPINSECVHTIFRLSSHRVMSRIGDTFYLGPQ